MAIDYCHLFSSQYPFHWQEASLFAKTGSGNVPPLLHLEIHPIPPKTCYNRCIYCAGKMTPAPPEAEVLPPEKMIAAANDAVSLGARMIVAASNSGDPALVRGLGKFFRHLQENTTVRWGLHTCGRDLDRLVESLTLSREDRGYISVGLDAVLEPPYQATKRPRSNFPGHEHACSELMGNLRSLCKKKRERKSGPFISLSCQLTRKNSGVVELERLLSFAFETPGINRVRFSVPFPPTNCSPRKREAFVRRVCPSETHLRDIRENIQRRVEELRTSAPNASVEIVLPAHGRGDSKTPRKLYSFCANQLLFAVLGPDSWIYPCTTVTATRLERRLVRFAEEGDLRRFWHSAARRSKLWFDVSQECSGFNCSNCEDEVNTNFRLQQPCE